MFLKSCNSLLVLRYERFQSSLLDYVPIEGVWALSELTILFISPIFMVQIRRVRSQTEVRRHQSEDDRKSAPQAEGVFSGGACRGFTLYTFIVIEAKPSPRNISS